MDNISDKPPPENLPIVLILQSLPVYNLYEPEFSNLYHFIKTYDSPLPLPDLLAAAKSAGVTALLAGGSVPINATSILDHLPSLRCIVTTTAGLNHVDLVECRRRGIAVASAGDSYSDDCADMAVALLIDVFRKVCSGDQFVQRGDWSVEGQYGLGNRVISSYN